MPAQVIAALFFQIFLLVFLPHPLSSQEKAQEFTSLDFTKYFQSMEASFLLYDLSDERLLIDSNPPLSLRRASPCSTFKIPSSMIALEEGVLDHEEIVLQWDGSKMPYPCWEKDQNLKSAVRHSVVWFFQRLARQIGSDKFNKYLLEFDYGNKDLSSGETSFWLNGSLQISPMEQLVFLNKFYNKRLPISARTGVIVKMILVQEKTDEYTLSGKTGSASKKKLGWYVGHVAAKGKEYTFVTFIHGDSSGPEARELTKQILADMGIIGDVSDSVITAR